jgi:hypothetical protein
MASYDMIDDYFNKERIIQEKFRSFKVDEKEEIDISEKSILLTNEEERIRLKYNCHEFSNLLVKSKNITEDSEIS